MNSQNAKRHKFHVYCRFRGEIRSIRRTGDVQRVVADDNCQLKCYHLIFRHFPSTSDISRYFYVFVGVCTGIASFFVCVTVYAFCVFFLHLSD